mgnify:CR=1 FL=1
MNRRMRTAKIILEILEDGNPRRWTEISKSTIMKSPTPAAFRGAFRWLLKNSYIEKLDRGLYSITDKGRILLEAL